MPSSPRQYQSGSIWYISASNWRSSSTAVFQQRVVTKCNRRSIKTPGSPDSPLDLVQRSLDNRRKLFWGSLHVFSIFRHGAAPSLTGSHRDRRHHTHKRALSIVFVYPTFFSRRFFFFSLFFFWVRFFFSLDFFFSRLFFFNVFSRRFFFFFFLDFVFSIFLDSFSSLFIDFCFPGFLFFSMFFFRGSAFSRSDCHRALCGPSEHLLPPL